MISKARLNLTDEELVEQIEETPYLQFFIGLEAFEYAAPLDPIDDGLFPQAAAGVGQQKNPRQEW